MTPHDGMDAERLRRLMMAALDGETSPEQRRELDEILASDAEAREEWERLARVKEVTRTMGFREPPEEVWDRYWTSVYNRTERGVGWILVSIGSIVLLGYGVWAFVREFLEDDRIPLPLRMAVLALAMGLVVIVVSVAREKLFTWRRDPYKGVER